MEAAGAVAVPVEELILAAEAAADRDAGSSLLHGLPRHRDHPACRLSIVRRHAPLYPPSIVRILGIRSTGRISGQVPAREEISVRVVQVVIS